MVLHVTRLITAAVVGIPLWWSSGGHRWERLFFRIKGLTVKLVFCCVFVKCYISTNAPAVWAAALNLWH